MKGQSKSSWLAVVALFSTSLAGVAQINTSASGTAAYPGAANNTGRVAVPNSNQTRSGRMASPGTVNYVEGEVTLNGNPVLNPSAGSSVVGPDQVIATGNGYAEVLLSPGAFLRIGHNSEVRMISAGLASIQLEVTHGTAIVESAELVKGSTLEVLVKGVSTTIEKGGLYAFDSNEQSLRVLDGKARVRQGSREITLKKGNELLLATDSDRPLKKRDFALKSAQSDPLYVWSKVRRREEAQANVHTANVVLAGSGWYGPGLYWDPFWSGYAFLPGFGMWNSPFGWGFYSPSFLYAAPRVYGRGYIGAAYVTGVGPRVRAIPSGRFGG